MRKTNKIEFKININEAVFDMEMKHEVPPLKMIEILSKLKMEYTILLIESDQYEEAMKLFENLNVIKRLEEKGEIKLKIHEYDVNNYKLDTQKIYEVDYNNKYDALDVLGMLLMALQFTKDLIMEDFGISQELHNMDKEDAVQNYAEFLKMLDMHNSVADIKAMAGITYKREATEEMIVDSVNDIMKMMDSSGEVLDLFFDGSSIEMDMSEAPLDEKEIPAEPVKDVNFDEFSLPEGEFDIEKYAESLGLGEDLEEVVEIDQTEKEDPLAAYREEALKAYEELIDVIRASALDHNHDHDCGCGHHHHH